MSSRTEISLGGVLARLASDAKDKNAWNDLYSLLWLRAKSIAFRSLHGLSGSAEDAAQEVFVRLMRYCDFSKFSTEAQFLAYFHTVCENVANDLLHELRWHREDIEEQDGDLPIMFLGDSPERQAVTRQLLNEIWTELDEGERVLAEMVAEGYTLQEIGLRFGWSDSNAGVRVHRLRVHARKHMKQKGLDRTKSL
jgi:RNA polymerase sigma factor (sigma-70 family)